LTAEEALKQKWITDEKVSTPLTLERRTVRLIPKAMSPLTIKNNQNFVRSQAKLSQIAGITINSQKGLSPSMSTNNFTINKRPLTSIADSMRINFKTMDMTLNVPKQLQDTFRSSNKTTIKPKAAFGVRSKLLNLE
jgi:hypothetical protein